MVVRACQQHCTRWRTRGSYVKAGEASAFGGKCVECRRCDFASEGTDIGKGKVVGNDDKYVGLARTGSRCRCQCSAGQQQEGCASKGHQKSSVSSSPQVRPGVLVEKSTTAFVKEEIGRSSDRLRPNRITL